MSMSVQKSQVHKTATRSQDDDKRLCLVDDLKEVQDHIQILHGLTLRHWDTINDAARGTLMKRRPEECYDLIENMTAHYNDWDTLAQRGKSSGSITSSSPEIAALTQQIAKMNKKYLRMCQSNQQVVMVNPSCETCGGPHHYSECQADGGFTQGDVYAATGNYNMGANQMTTMEKAFNERPQGVLPSNTIPNPREDIKVITTRSGMTLGGPSVPPPPSFSSKEPALISKSNEIPERNPHQPLIPYPLRLNKDKLQDKFDIQIHKFLQMFKKLHFNISFAEALAQMPKYAKMLKDLLSNKEKLLELANTPLNENCLAVLLKKLPEKVRDPGKFLIPYDFSELEDCMALADLGASINLMPLSVWKTLMLPELVPTRMTLKLANRSVAYPAGIVEDVFVQVGKFTFPVDFVVVDYDVDPRVPLIIGRPFLRTARALVDVYGEDLTLRVGDEKLIFNVESTLKYPHKHGDDPTPSSDPVVSSLSPSLTPFGDSDFLLEEIDALLSLDNSIPLEIGEGIFDPDGDILLLKKLLNNDSTKDLPPKELKNDEIKTTKSSIEEPPDLELKYLPPHLEYAFLEGTSKLPIIIAKNLREEEKDQLIKRRVNPKIHEVIKAEVIKLLDTGLIYPISDSPWVSLVHVVPKKGGMTVVTNDNNELILTRLVMGWRVCIDYQKLNDATRKDHFPLPFIDQMLERLAVNEFYCFLDGFSRYFQIPIDP
ncbi:reverse transcriptase domain-containing protein [Tanacetum coccineum]